MRSLGQSLDGLTYTVVKVESDCLQFQLSRFDFREIQDVVDDA